MRAYGQQTVLGRCLISVFWLMMCASKHVNSAGIPGAHITNFDGNAQARYLFDEQKRGTVGQPQNEESRPTFEQEIFVRAQGFAYHPNLMRFEVGGGPVFQQSEFNSNVGSNSENEADFNFLTRLSFLEKKPYPVAFYYNQTHPSLSVGLTGRFQQENINYGLDAALLEPVSPVQLTLNAQKSETNGQGFDVIVDDTVETVTLRAHRAYNAGDFIELTQNWNQSLSLSGNPALPVQEASTDSNATSLNTRNFFGADKQIRLSTVATYSILDTVIADQKQPDIQNLRIFPDIRWNHSKKLYSFYRYNFQESENGPIETTNQNLVGGLVYLKNEHQNANVDVHAEDNKSTGQQQNIFGSNGSVSYLIPADWGALNMSAGLRLDNNTQDANRFITVIDESHQFFAGQTEVTLSNDFVEEDSISVRLNNSTIELTIDVDYELEFTGSVTIIRRLGAGAINDDDIILVTYNYLSQGEGLDYRTLEQNYQFGLDYEDWFNAFIRYRDLKNNLLAGTLNFPLNDIQSTTYGINLNKHFWQAWQAGAEAQFQDQKEDISPFERETYNIYLQMPVTFINQSSLRLSAGLAHTDNLSSVEDSDLTRYGMRFFMRRSRNSSFAYETSQEEDTGGSLRELRREHAANFQWRFRKLSFIVEARYTDEEQGTFERERTVMRAMLRRDFGR